MGRLTRQIGAIGIPLAVLAAPGIAQDQKTAPADITAFKAYVQQRIDRGTLNKTHGNALLNSLSLPSSPSNGGASYTLRPPSYPFNQKYSVLPNGKEAMEYEERIRKHLSQLDLLNNLKEEFSRETSLAQMKVNVPKPGGLSDPPSFANTVLQLNGEIFWAPASKSTDIVTRAGDEARAVFGPIPPFDTSVLGKRTLSDGSTIETAQLRLEVDGNFVELKRNPSKPGSPLEFEHTDLNGRIVRWTNTIPKCDKPSLAGGVTPCGTSSRISRVVRANAPVEWIALARKTKGVDVLTNDAYWMPSDPDFTLIGYIGFNRFTGEIAFFDGAGNLPGGHRSFNWNQPIVPPGGVGYNDSQGREKAAKLYDGTFRIDCAGCHENRDPITVTPYIKLSRVGYRDDTLRQLGSVGELFPEKIRTEKDPYRVVGTGYTSIHGTTLDTAMSIGHVSPAKSCTECHGITNLGAGRFASDSVGRLGELNDSDEAEEKKYRTDWAMRGNSGQIHPWMVPIKGQDISGSPLPESLSNEEWELLKNAINDPLSVPGSKKIYTKAPAPGSGKTSETLLADPSVPKFSQPTVTKDSEGENVTVTMNWTYLNSLGGVPERDDVRFHVAIREMQLPIDGSKPTAGDYPSIEDAKALAAERIVDEVYLLNDIVILSNVSFKGHQKWTDPAPTTNPRLYSIKFPGVRDHRYLIRVVAKRFSFDRDGQIFSTQNDVFAIDVPAN